MHATPVQQPSRSRIDRGRFVIAAIVAAVGLVWAAQGTGAPIGGSFMVGDPFWTVAGVALVVAAGLYAAWPKLGRP